MNPYLLQHLDDRLGNPCWFWPAVSILLLALWMCGGTDE